jgi:hypothetical protein
VGVVPGNQSSLAPVVVWANRSGWGPCVGELGGGLVALFQIARQLVQTGGNRPVILVAAGGGEIGQVGLKAFLDQHTELARSAHAWLELGSSLGARGSSLQIEGAEGALLDQMVARLRIEGARTDAIKAQTTFHSRTARLLAARGANVVSVCATPGNTYRLPGDRLPKAVDLDQVTAIGNALATVVLEMARA